MSNIAIRVDQLGKQYRIGKSLKVADGHKSRLRAITEPFRYLANTLRPPSEDEIIWALKDVSFEVEHGKAIAIVGRNGAGKSTLLKLLARITEPTEGQAVIHGRVAALLEVGTGFHPELTGRENIYLSGAILGMKRAEIERKFDEIVGFSGVEQFIDTPIKYYSSGMRVRLGFAVAAHLEPEVLLIDEVLAVGDAEFQKKCLGRMSEVAHEGRTVLFVSHNMAAVQALCTRGIFLQKGSILVEGTAAEAVSTYLRLIENMTQQGLAERTDRDGAGLMRLVKVAITNPDDPQSKMLSTGGPARFEFHIDHIPPGMIFEYVDFTIYDFQGRAIAYFNSADRGPQDAIDAELGTTVVCTVDELILLPGRYRINVGLKGNGDMQDHIEGAAFFDVEEGNIRGRPVVARSQRLGNVILSHRWALPVSR